MRVRRPRMRVIQSVPSSSGGTDRCAQMSGCVFLFVVVQLLMLVLFGAGNLSFAPLRARVWSRE